MSATARPARPITLSQIPRRVNLRLYAGDRFAMTLSVTERNGTPIDMEGQQLRAQIRRIPESDVILGQFLIVTVEHRVVPSLTGEMTARLPSPCAYDVEWTDRELTLAFGQITFVDQVTRDE